MDNYCSERYFYTKSAPGRISARKFRHGTLARTIAAFILAIISFVFSKRAVGFVKAALVCLVIAVFLGLVGGIENGSVPLWVGVPVSLVLMASVAYRFVGKD